MYCVSGWLTIFEPSTSSSESGLRRHAFGFRAPFANAFDGHLRERRGADAVLGHVALDLHREELRREHQAGLAVPGAEPPVLGQRVERARRVLVEADDERGLALRRTASIACAVASAEPPVAQPLRTLMNGTPVRPSTETVVSALPAASEPPAANSTSCQPRPASRERRARGDRGHLEPGDARVAAEGMDAQPDDRDVGGRGHRSSAGAKA